MAPDSFLATLSSQPRLLALVRTALRTPQAQHSSPSAPAGTLPVLLFLLDALVFLRDTPSPSNQDGGSSSSTGVRSKRRGERGDEGDHADVEASAEARRWDHSSDSIEAEEERENDWEEWVSYIAEVYLHPIPGKVENAWFSPLHIPSAVLPSLPTLCASTSYTPTAGLLLSSAALSAYSYLSPSPPPLATLLELPLPLLLPHSVLANLSSTLASRRRAAAHSPASSIQTFQSILVTILEHLFGSEAYKVVGDKYASDEADDRAIKAFFARPPPVFTEEEEDYVVDGVRKASASIQKRDDKLRWIFGDNFQSRQIPAKPVQASQLQSLYDNRSHSVEDLLPPPLDLPRRARPVSLSSISSSSRSTPALHRRLDSTSSSIRPLLRPSAPPSIHTPSPLLPTPSHVPFANLAPAPPSPAHSEFASTNTLTAEERRDHVRRTRKLQNLLGSPLDERTLRGRSLDVSRPTGRRHSIPPPSPTSPHEFDFGRPVGLGSSVSMARSSSSPIPLTPSTESFRPAIPNASSFSALGGTPELVREERRRKLAKVQRLLGEKVPAHLALNDEVGGRMGSVGRKGIRGRLKGALGIGRRGSKGSETREQWFERAETTRVVEMEMDREESSVARETTSQIAPVGPVKGMAKARKLEQLFGDLPPTSLYLARPQMSHQRSVSDISSLHSFSRQSRALSSSSSIASYCTSIASLKYLIERDPDALDDIAREYARESDVRTLRAESTGGETDPPTSPTYDPLEISDSDQEVEVDDVQASVQSSTSSAFAPESKRGSEVPSKRESTIRDSSSSSSQGNWLAASRSLSSTGLGKSSSSKGPQFRTVKKAQKLASFFGTTRGQVWGMLLDDLETTIAEEEGLDEEERQEVLGRVSRLREAAA